jgi:glycosyltransferase involved in cell wall biosynthesis
MRALFAGWPRAELAQLHADPHRDFERDVCARYLQAAPGGPGPLARLARRWTFARGRPTRRVRKWVESFAPQVIYARLVDRPWPFLAWPAELARHSGARLVCHIMDDWPERLRRADAAAHQRADARLRTALAQAQANLCICDAMAVAFQQRYGVVFGVCHNGIEPHEWSQPRREHAWEGAAPFELLYAGSLAEDMQLESVIDVAHAVGRLAARGRRVRLVVQTNATWLPAFRRHLAALPGVEARLQVTRDEYARSLAASDALVFPVNFDDASLAYVRYSFANKLPEYMASGSPILAYGPRESASIEHLARGGLSQCVCRRDPEALEQAIEGLMDSPPTRAALAAAARAAALRDHSLPAIRAAFHALLRGAG